MSLAIALASARIKKLETELNSLDDDLRVLLKSAEQIEDRKWHLKRQLENTVLQTAYIKRLLTHTTAVTPPTPKHGPPRQKVRTNLPTF